MLRRAMTPESFRQSTWQMLFAVASGAFWGCAPSPALRVVSVEPPPPKAVDVAPAKSEPGDEAFAFVVARIAIGRTGEAATAWRDIEVQGPYRIARRTCEALLRRELSVRYPAETALENRPDRPCSAAPLAEPPFAGPYVLAQTDWPTGPALVLEGVSDGPESPSLKIRRRHASAFVDKAACEAALLRIEAAGAEARTRANASAATFLDAQIRKQEEGVRSACTAPRSAACARVEEVLEVLRNTARRRSHEPRPSDESIAPTNVCYRI